MRHGSIIEDCPELAEQWDPDLNIDEKTGAAVTPEHFTLGSNLQGVVAPAMPSMRGIHPLAVHSDRGRIRSIVTVRVICVAWKLSGLPLQLAASTVPASSCRSGTGVKEHNLTPAYLLSWQQQEGMVEMSDMQCRVGGQGCRQDYWSMVVRNSAHCSERGRPFTDDRFFALSSLTPMQASWMLRVVDAARPDLWEQHSQGCVELCRSVGRRGACMSEPGLLQ